MYVLPTTLRLIVLSVKYSKGIVNVTLRSPCPSDALEIVPRAFFPTSFAPGEEKLICLSLPWQQLISDVRVITESLVPASVGIKMAPVVL